MSSLAALVLTSGGLEAENAQLHFDVPAPCSQAWAARGGGNKGANRFGMECLAKYAKQPRLTEKEVMSYALDAVRADPSLTSSDPKDVETFCPRYRSLGADDRRVFWATLLTAISKPESDYAPMSSFWEGPNDPEYSIGLLQVSPSNRAAYGCDFDSEARLTDPATNMACGTRIMGKLVGKSQVIGGGTRLTARSGGAAYWSTLRAPAYKPSRATGPLAGGTRARIASTTASLPICR